MYVPSGASAPTFPIGQRGVLLLNIYIAETWSGATDLERLLERMLG